MSRVFGIAVMFAACGTHDTGSTPFGTFPIDPTPGWATVAANDSLRTSVDTTRITSQGDTTRVWIAVKDITTPANRAVESPFLRFETLQEIECAKGRAHGIAIRTPDSAGVFFESPINDARWKTFGEHGLGPSVLTSVCKYLGTMARG
jgi:hypothetical protein